MESDSGLSFYSYNGIHYGDFMCFKKYGNNNTLYFPEGKYVLKFCKNANVCLRISFPEEYKMNDLIISGGKGISDIVISKDGIVIDGKNVVCDECNYKI